MTRITAAASLRHAILHARRIYTELDYAQMRKLEIQTGLRFRPPTRQL